MKNRTRLIERKLANLREAEAAARTGQFQLKTELDKCVVEYAIHLWQYFWKLEKLLAEEPSRKVEAELSKIVPHLLEIRTVSELIDDGNGIHDSAENFR